jgi:hypothetical protein
MKNISNLLREQNPTKWVAYVDLKKNINEFRLLSNDAEFSRFFAEKILKLQFEFEINFFKKLYDIGKVLILFDGFDEIAPDCAEYVSHLIMLFEKKGGNQLWIATRDFFEIDLKELL